MRFRPSLFWDVDPKTIDTKKHAKYIIERVMNFGYDKEVRWMWKMYPKSLLRKVVDESRELDAKSRNFWDLILPKRTKFARKKSPFKKPKSKNLLGLK